MDVSIDAQTLSLILNVILALISVYAGKQLHKFKKGVKLTREKLEDIQSLIEHIQESTEDNYLDPDEIEKMIEDIYRILE